MFVTLVSLQKSGSISVAHRNQALKNAKEVFAKWCSDFGIGGVPEEAEKAMSMRLRNGEARERAIPIGVTVILTEFEHLSKDFEQLLEG